MTDKKQRGRPRRQAPSEVPATQAIEPVAQIETTQDVDILSVTIEVDTSKPTSIHQVLGQMTEIITAPQEVKRSGYKW